MCQIKLVTIICTIVHIVNSGIMDSLKNNIDKAKSLYKKKEETKLNYLGYDPNEYPGTNEQKRQINTVKWDLYYECLLHQSMSFGDHGGVTPEALLVYEGNSVTFECNICISPIEQKSDSIIWYSQTNKDKHLEPIEYTEHVLLHPEDKSLKIYSVNPDHSGQYLCKLGESHTPVYFLTVVNDKEPLNKVKPNTAPNGPHAEPDLEIPYLKLKLTTIWESWSPCTVCGKVGIKVRFGICTVIYNENSILIQQKESVKKVIEKSGFSLNSPKIRKQRDLKMEEAIEIMKIFKDGIPCHSHIIPKPIKKLSKIRLRRNELMTAFCKVNCSGSEIFEVVDKEGNVLEVANNSAGIYSMQQGLPQDKPAVSRQTIYRYAGEKLTLICPGNLNSDVPVQWQIGSKVLKGKLIKQESNGRVSLYMKDYIQITKLLMSDSGIYSCWQNSELAGTTRLLVTQNHKLNFNHHIMLVGLILIFSTFLYIFSKAIYNRKQANI